MINRWFPFNYFAPQHNIFYRLVAACYILHNQSASLYRQMQRLHLLIMGAASVV